ncbi:MSHA biogenesis protein MshJ [Zobellella sp. An-6]|uniref:MSHA biogenesis protein MshJ n=1 Tax=Zobellella sp. An-6 TaxID=3400218 RepID=UPI0040411666
MTAWKQQVDDWFMARPRRERWLLLAAVWALLAWMGLVLYEQTLAAGVASLRQQQQQLNRTLEEQQRQREELNQGIARLSGDSEQQRLERLNQRLSRLNENVEQRMRTLVGPEQMATLLLSILEQSQGLVLHQLSNRPPQPLDTGEGEPLYRHDLSLHLSGGYLPLLDYVERLEQLSGRIFWQGLEFELEQYPEGSIRLDFFTISQHKELLRG